MLPQMLYDPELRPTKVDRPSDVTNLVDTGDLVYLSMGSGTDATLNINGGLVEVGRSVYAGIGGGTATIIGAFVKGASKTKPFMRPSMNAIV